MQPVYDLAGLLLPDTRQHPPLRFASLNQRLPGAIPLRLERRPGQRYSHRGDPADKRSLPRQVKLMPQRSAMRCRYPRRRGELRLREL